MKNDISKLIRLVDFFYKIAAPRYSKEYYKGNLSEKEMLDIEENTIPNKIFEKHIDKPNTFIHFSDIKRFGFNPKYSFNTPFGVYSYPLTSELALRISEFATDRNYIHIFECIGNKLDLGNYSEEDFKEDLDKLKNNIFRGTDIKNTILNGSITAKINEPSTKLWNITRLLANKNPTEWSNLFKKLGYSFVVDSKAQGIIHPGEPYQALCFIGIDKNNINFLTTIPNKLEEYKKILNKAYIKNLKNNKNNLISNIKNNLKDFADKISIFIEDPIFRKEIIELAKKNNRTAINMLNPLYNDMRQAIIYLINYDIKSTLSKLDNNYTPYMSYKDIRQAIIEPAKNGDNFAIRKLNPKHDDMRQALIELAKKGNTDAISRLNVNDTDMRQLIIELAKQNNVYAINKLDIHHEDTKKLLLELAEQNNVAAIKRLKDIGYSINYHDDDDEEK